MDATVVAHDRSADDLVGNLFHGHAYFLAIKSTIAAMLPESSIRNHA
jgi:hypothetical protein